MQSPVQIKGPDGKVLYTTPINEGCKRRFLLMNEDSITIKFSDANKIEFPIGCSIGNYYLTTTPQYKANANTGGYDYELKFNAYYWLWQNKLLTYVMPGGNYATETSFKLTASIEKHGELVKRALDNLGYKFDNSPYRIDTSDTSLSAEAKFIDYNNLSILDAIALIAETFECEWWVDENAVCFGKLQDNGSYEFTVGENVEMVPASSQEAKANRLYIFGSDRNLPTNYRETDEGDVVGAIVQKKLMLPGNIPYLQTEDYIPESAIIEKVVTFDDIYPQTELEVTGVEEYISKTEDEKGNEITQKFYRIKYNPEFLFSHNYILPETELHVVFSKGLLNGMDFAVEFNPKGLNERMIEDDGWNPDAQMLEIVVNEDYGRQLPDDILKPEIGDTFVLYGWDTTKLAALGLVEAAEKKLLKKGEELLEEYRKDMSNYDCVMMSDWCKERIDNLDTPKPGAMINLHFAPGDAGRLSRIIGYECDLDFEYSNVKYTLGKNVSVSRLKQLESSVKGLTHNGEKIRLQNSLDFLSKRYNDRTPFGLQVGGNLRADKQLMVGKYVQGFAGAGIDEKGNGEFESIESRSWLKVQELIYNRLNALEGNTSFADVGTIETLSPGTDGRLVAAMRKRWDGDFTAFQEGDVIYGYVNKLDSSVKEFYKSWALVESVDRDTNSLVLFQYADKDVPGGKNFPVTEEMIITRWGNKTNPKRQSSFYISCEDGNIVQLMGVHQPILEEGNYGAILGKIPKGLLDDAIEELVNEDQPYLYLRGLLVQDIIRINYKGALIQYGNFRGEWSFDIAESDEYYDVTREYYDIVRYNGCLWRCLSPQTRSTPGKDPTAWEQMTDIYEGKPLSVWQIIPNANVITIRENAVDPEEITCEVTKINADTGSVTYNSSYDLTLEGVKLYYSIDGSLWKPFIIGNTSPLELEDGSGYIELEKPNGDDIYITLGGDNTPTDYIGDKIKFQIRDIETGCVLAQTEIPVIRDGENGKDGENGPIAYPAGEYNVDATYISTGETTPVVLYNENYYCLKPNKIWENSSHTPIDYHNPAYNIKNAANPSWILFDKFQAIFTEILFADFAKLASGVFFRNWLMSQYGQDGRSDYQNFKEDGTGFIPNFAVNLLTGELNANKGVFRGDIYATHGVFSGLVKRNPTVITPLNYKDYSVKFENTGEVAPGVTATSVTYWLDWNKCGTYIILEGTEEVKDFVICLPSIYTGVATAGVGVGATLEECRQYIGVTVMIYNRSKSGVGVTGAIQPEGEYSDMKAHPESFSLNPGECVALTCHLTQFNDDDNGYEQTVWEYRYKCKFRD